MEVSVEVRYLFSAVGTLLLLFLLLLLLDEACAGGGRAAVIAAGLVTKMGEIL